MKRLSPPFAVGAVFLSRSSPIPFRKLPVKLSIFSIAKLFKALYIFTQLTHFPHEQVFFVGFQSVTGPGDHKPEKGGGGFSLNVPVDSFITIENLGDHGFREHTRHSLKQEQQQEDI